MDFKDLSIDRKNTTTTLVLISEDKERKYDLVEGFKV